MSAQSRADEVTRLAQKYNRPDQANDALAVETRIALREYAVLLIEHDRTQNLLISAIAKASEDKPKRKWF